MSLLSVIIPCFNEEGSLCRFERELFPALTALNRDFEVVAVDDGSSDATARILSGLAGQHPVSVKRHPKNLGLGASLRTGFDGARGEWIVTLDADLTFHPRHIRDLLDRQGETGADLVSGSPFLVREGPTGIALSRFIPSLAINSLYRALFDRRFTSYTPIFRLYRAARLRSLPLRAEGFEINAEIAALFHRRRFSMAETPVPLLPRREGSSKLRRWREFSRHARLITRLLLVRP